MSKYCKRYGKRLQDTAFVKELGVHLLLRNHHTVGRALLEVYVNSEQTLQPAEMREVVRQIWLPLFEQPTLLNLANMQDFKEHCKEEQLTSLFICMMMAGWSDRFPLLNEVNWVEKAQRFLYGRYLIEQAEKLWGKRFWETELLWSPSLQQLGCAVGRSDDTEKVVKKFAKLATYITPIEEKFKAHTTKAVIGDSVVCPATYMQLPLEDLNRLKRGELVQSPYKAGVLLLWKPKLDKDMKL